MDVAIHMDKARECFEKAERIREQVRLRKAGRKVKVERGRPPSYEGNDWAGYPSYLPIAGARGYI
jgi:hypothetical protein